jgi:hypothetical protein
MWPRLVSRWVADSNERLEFALLTIEEIGWLEEKPSHMNRTIVPAMRDGARSVLIVPIVPAEQEIFFHQSAG